LTKPAPEFDAEKRRRWYGAWFGIAGATSFIGAALLTEGHALFQSDEKAWVSLLVIFGFWLIVALIKYVAGYAIWSKPYASRKRAIALSLTAMLAVYLGFFGCGILFALFQGIPVTLKSLVKSFYELNRGLFGLPYIAAAIVGWCFARPAPDARDQF